jgi:hypothetical protein
LAVGSNPKSVFINLLFLQNLVEYILYGIRPSSVEERRPSVAGLRG